MLNDEDRNKDTPSVFNWNEMCNCPWCSEVLPRKKPSSVKFSLYNFPSLMSLMYPSSRVDAFWFQMCFTKLPSKNLIKKSVQFNSSTFTFTAMKTGSWKLISIWELTEKYEEFLKKNLNNEWTKYLQTMTIIVMQGEWPESMLLKFSLMFGCSLGRLQTSQFHCRGSSVHSSDETQGETWSF